MFSHINEKLSPRPFKWCSWTQVYLKKWPKYVLQRFLFHIQHMYSIPLNGCFVLTVFRGIPKTPMCPSIKNSLSSHQYFFQQIWKGKKPPHPSWRITPSGRHVKALGILSTWPHTKPSKRKLFMLQAVRADAASTYRAIKATQFHPRHIRCLGCPSGVPIRRAHQASPSGRPIGARPAQTHGTPRHAASSVISSASSGTPPRRLTAIPWRAPHASGTRRGLGEPAQGAYCQFGFGSWPLKSRLFMGWSISFCTWYSNGYGQAQPSAGFISMGL